MPETAYRPTAPMRKSLVHVRGAAKPPHKPTSRCSLLNDPDNAIRVRTDDHAVAIDEGGAASHPGQ